MTRSEGTLLVILVLLVALAVMVFAGVELHRLLIQINDALQLEVDGPTR